MADEYRLVGSCNGWSLSCEPMAVVRRDNSGRPALLECCVVLGGAAGDSDGEDGEAACQGEGGGENGGARSGGAESSSKRRRVCEEFQIVAGGRWEDRLFPGEDARPMLLRLGEESLVAEGAAGHGRNWRLEGEPGDVFSVLLALCRRTVRCELIERRSGGSYAAARWRGVNLGGWLVLEQWMSPALFEELAPGSGDEQALLRRGGEAARLRVQAFRDSFIQCSDLEWLAREGGVNAVRLPVGYWCFEEDALGTVFLPTRDYVDLVFDWAEAVGLRVLLDFHGAVGGQNGEHHSGATGGRVAWLEPANRRKNLEILERWARRWGKRKAFLALGLGNEVAAPAPAAASCAAGLLRALPCGRCRSLAGRARGYWEQAADFYAEASRRVRPHLHPDAPLVIDTCWETQRFLQGRLNGVQGPVWLDYHHYECFGATHNVEEHCRVDGLKQQLAADLARPGGQAPFELVLGEFSLALKPECPGYEADGWQRRLFRQQAALAAQRCAGWFFWSYKMDREGWDHWSYRASVERGWIRP